MRMKYLVIMAVVAVVGILSMTTTLLPVVAQQTIYPIYHTNVHLTLQCFDIIVYVNCW